MSSRKLFKRKANTGEVNEVKAGDGIRTIKWVTREELKDHLLFPNQLDNAEKVIQEFLK